MAEIKCNKIAYVDPKTSNKVTLTIPEVTEGGDIIIPDATDSVKGGVILSDAIDGSQNAATGKTAATPKAVADAISNVTTTINETVKNEITNIVSGGEVQLVPDATDVVKGSVLLTDTPSDLSATTGATALSPKALNDYKTENDAKIGSLDDLTTTSKDNLVAAINEIKSTGGSGGEAVETPDATDSVKGKTQLSDAIDSDSNAATGVTAATPLAVKSVNTKIGNLEDLNTEAKDNIVAAINEVKTTGGSGEPSGGYIVTPIIINPLPEQVDVNPKVTIQGTAYRNVFPTDIRKVRKFQIATDTGFSSKVIDKDIASDSYTHNESLSESTKYYVRIKDYSVGALESAWSPVISFTTGTVSKINTPTLTVEGAPYDVLANPTLTTSNFSTQEGSSDTHQSTDWIIKDSTNTSVVWQSLNDTVNKTTIKVPESTLKAGTLYTISVRHKGASLGYSNYYFTVIQTSSDFGKVVAPSLRIQGMPDQVYDGAIMMGGLFTTTREDDTHEMTDWEIKLIQDNSVVWKSYSDTSNKTLISTPTGIMQPNKSYIGRVRYKGTKLGWSDWTEISFSTKEDFTKTEIAPYVPTKGIHFKGNGSQTNIYLFNPAYTPDSSGFTVKINGELTEQSIYSLTYNHGDDILIESIGGKFPRFECRHNLNGVNENVIKELLEPLPKMWKSDSEPITSADNMFAGQSYLEKVVPYTFANNPNIEDFSYCFYQCDSLTEIVSKLFANCFNAKNFSYCFAACDKIVTIAGDCLEDCYNASDFSYFLANARANKKDIPETLFKNCPNITDLSYCFNDCSLTTPPPSNLFKNCPNVTNLEYCFSNNDNMPSLPNDLIISCTKITKINNFLYGIVGNCTVNNLIIKANNISYASQFKSTACKVTVSVLKDSVTSRTFKNLSGTDRPNIIEVEFEE